LKKLRNLLLHQTFLKNSSENSAFPQVRFTDFLRLSQGWPADHILYDSCGGADITGFSQIRTNVNKAGGMAMYLWGRGDGTLLYGSLENGRCVNGNALSG
jgi:hypothetical protein